MKISCSKDLLCEAVMNVSRAVPSKSTIMALEGILFKAAGSTLTLTGYDLELGITTLIDATVEEEGNIILSAKLITDMIRRMPGESIRITSDEKLLTNIVSGAAEYTILGLDPQEFPELPAVTEDGALSIEAGLLRSFIEQTLFAIAVTDAKPVHKGSLFDIKNSALTLVSVDGFRLALRREALPLNEEYHFVVPGKTLSEVAKLLTDPEAKIKISLSHKYVIFHIGGYNVLSRLLEGEFLDYSAAIPTGCQTAVTVQTRPFIECIERISLLISDKLRSSLKISFSGNAIYASCSTTIGKANDKIECAITGDEIDMGFNSKYLVDALRACDSDEVLLELNGPLSPMKIVPKEGDGFLFLVLPVRLKND